MHTGILGYTFDEYKELVKKFHGATAPGVIIGGFMVDTAVAALADGATRAVNGLSASTDHPFYEGVRHPRVGSPGSRGYPAKAAYRNGTDASPAMASLASTGHPFHEGVAPPAAPVEGATRAPIFDAICETRSCLPDAIQLLTPCTVGNGWLKIIPLGLFALTLYDKATLEGVRVSLDIEKVEAWPEIKAWYLKLKSKHEQPLDDVLQEVRRAGSSIVSLKAVRVQPQAAARTHKGRIGVCPECGQAYPADDGPVCLLCRGGDVIYDGSWKEDPLSEKETSLSCRAG